MTNLNQNNQDDNQVKANITEQPLEQPIEEPVQIDLFADILGEDQLPVSTTSIPTSKGKKKLPGSKSATAAPKSEVSSKPNEPVKPETYGTDWVIAYAGVTIGLPNEMTEDEIHEFVERDYPELSKRRSRINFDKKDKMITFTVTGAKKG